MNADAVLAALRAAEGRRLSRADYTALIVAAGGYRAFGQLLLDLAAAGWVVRRRALVATPA